MPGMVQPQRECEWTEDGKLKSVKVRSLFSGEWHTMECDPEFVTAVTRAQWDAWQAGQNIASAMPQLSAEEREFLISGATPEEWDAAFKEDD